MKKFTKQEIGDLLIQGMLGEISFPEMVGVINEMVNPSEVIEFKDGDFVVNEAGVILIFKKKVEGRIYDHAYLSDCMLVTVNIPTRTPIGRYATEEEKQELLDALAKEGKRWNTEKLCVEDIPVRKFKKGDKVMLKSGCKDAPELLYFREMDKWIGKPITVSEFDHSDFIYEFSDFPFYLHKDWLEPYVEELKKGDLAIFWDDSKEHAIIRFYDRPNKSGEYFRHKDQNGFDWKNAIKFESKEQFEKLIKGDI